MASETNWGESLKGQRLFIGGEEVLPTTKSWNFLGVSVSYNHETGHVDFELGGSGFDWQQSVRVATSGPLPAHSIVGNSLIASANGSINGSGIDSVTTLAVGDRVLVKDESSQEQHGLYVIVALGGATTPWQLDRASVGDVTGEITSGLKVYAEEGSINRETTWKVSTSGTIVLNATAIVFKRDSLEVADDGSLMLRVGSSTTPVATVGHLRLANQGGGAGLVQARNAANSLDVGVLTFDSANDLLLGYLSGARPAHVYIDCATSAEVRVAGSKRLDITATGVGFNGQAAAARPDYTVTNHTNDRALDETADTLVQVANVVGTLINDLIAAGILQ